MICEFIGKCQEGEGENFSCQGLLDGCKLRDGFAKKGRMTKKVYVCYSCEPIDKENLYLSEKEINDYDHKCLYDIAESNRHKDKRGEPEKCDSMDEGVPKEKCPCWVEVNVCRRIEDRRK